MTVKHGRKFLSIPGPTTVPDEVLRAMHHPATDIYTGPLPGITDSCLADLKKIFRTAGNPYIYISNGHGSWEAALSNVLSRGDKVLVLASGRFALGWGDMAEAMGAEVEVVPCDWRKAVDPAVVEERLRQDHSGEIKAVLVVQVDTASGVVNDIPAIRAALDATGHNALFCVDTIASLGTMPFEMDEWGVDVAVTGSQKGLMMPPGLSFVAANAKAEAVHQTANLRTRYWDWTARKGELHYEKYCGTPPVQQLYGLRTSLDLLLEEGLDSVIQRHQLLADAARSAVEAWSEGGVIGFNILDPQQRANSVTVVTMAEGHSPDPLLEYCQQRCGVTLGIGIGGQEDSAFRIAHMGHINAPMLLGSLSVIEMGLIALGIPHGSGGAGAAIQHLGKSVPAT
ncbi:MAG: aminotransferase class V-fold PLP-dependent enzyme [SAR324 cluster bacterium]|nr:aminotransferase class V-fold PLP-dependent enzyme [SAR324 cluster bacterium]